MKFSIKLASTTGILLALAACGGSSSSTPAEQSPDEEVVGRTNGAEALLFGTTSTTQSGNGLVFAAEGLEIDPEASLPAATVRLVRFVSDNVTGDTSLVISDEVVTIANFDNNMNDLSGTLTFNGETVEFTDGSGTLADGTSISIFVNGEPGDWSAIISPYSYVYGDGPTEPGVNTEGSFAIGLETNPGNMPTTTGTTTYVGGFNGYSTMLDLDGNVLANEVSIDGETTINVGFADGVVDGTLEFGTNADEGDAVPFNVFATLELQEADIIGNGFATSANVVVGCESANCSSDTQIGGAFFGPNGEEIAGVAGIDYSEGDGFGNGLRVVGAGGFVATVGGSGDDGGGMLIPVE